MYPVTEYLSKRAFTIRCHYLLRVRLHLAANLLVIEIVLYLRDLLLEPADLAWIALLAKLDLLLSDEGVLLGDRVLSLVVCCEIQILILVGLDELVGGPGSLFEEEVDGGLHWEYYESHCQA